MNNCPKMFKKFYSKTSGFTLIELLVVIGILAVLLAIVLILIINAITQFGADNNGTLPTGITTTAQNIADTAADLCAQLVPTYIAALPVDPTSGIDPVTNCGAAYDTEYTVIQSASNNRVTVAAPNAQLSAVISVTR